MPRIELSLTANYCPDWKLWEGIREIMQNAIDEQEYNGGRMIAEHLPRSSKLVVTSEGVTLDHSVLLLGASGKSGNERGHFGEGLKVGVLALVRAGHPVTVYNGDEVWRPVLEPSETFAGKDVLCFQTRKLQKAREDFTIEVENISRPVWDELKKKFLFLTPPKAKDVIKVDGGALLLHPDRKGEIYVKGIYVNEVKDLECGYDLEDMQLDRDRRVIDGWNLKYKLGELWQRASAQHPEQAAKRVYDMAASGKSDAEHLHYHADQKLVKAMRDTLEKQHGKDVLPVRDAEDQKRLEAVGIKAVVVTKALHSVLTKDMPAIDDIVNKAAQGLKDEFSPSELNDAERQGFAIAQRVLGGEFLVVEFNDGRPAVRYDVDKHTLCVAKNALVNEERELYKQLVCGEAARRHCTEADVYLDLLLPDTAAEQKAS